MNVENTVREVGWDEDVLEKPAHDDVLHAGLTAGPKNRGAEFLWRHVLSLFHDERRNVGLSGELQPARFRAAGDHQPNFRWQRSVTNLVDQIAQRRPATGEENSKWKARRHMLTQRRKDTERTGESNCESASR